MKIRTIVAKLSFLAGVALLGGGLFVLFRCVRSFSAAEIRLLIGVILMIWGAYFLGLSNTQHLRRRLEELEKRSPNP